MLNNIFKPFRKVKICSIMTNNRCFICLDATNPAASTLCQTCSDSTICHSCLQATQANETHQHILANCPICRKPTTWNLKISLHCWWHYVIAFFWFCAGYDIPWWLQHIMLTGSYRYMREVCRKVNREKDNQNPRKLRKRWTVWTNLTFIPYTIFLWMYPAGFSTSTNVIIFALGHIGFPIMASIMLYLINLMVLILNRQLSTN